MSGTKSSPRGHRMAHSYSTSDISLNTNPRRAELSSANRETSTTPALHSPKKIPANCHPYLVQTTSSSLLTRSPASPAPPREKEGHRISRSTSSLALDLSALQSSKDRSLPDVPNPLKPQHTGASNCSDISSISVPGGVGKGRKEGLWREWEDRAAAAGSEEAPRLRKTQSAWVLSSKTRALENRERKISGGSVTSTCSLDSSISLPLYGGNSHDSLHNPDQPSGDNRKKSSLYDSSRSVKSRYSQSSLSSVDLPSTAESENDEQEGDNNEWRTARKVTIRPSSLTTPGGIGEAREISKRVDELVRKYDDLQARLARMEGRRAQDDWLASVSSDNLVRGVGMVFAAGIGLGMAFGKVMSRR